MKLLGLATLGRDAEVRFTPQGDPVAGFSVAYNYGRKDTGGNMPTQWVECSLWGKRAESLAPYLLKGKQFYLELSDVHVETYEGRNGSGVKLVGRVAEVQFTRGSRDDDNGFEQRPARHHEDRKNPGPATGQGNSYAAAKGGRPAATPAQQQGGGQGVAGIRNDLPWDDGDDSIPF